MKIGIDLDDTINDLCSEWINRYNNDYEDNVKEFDDWDVTTCVCRDCGDNIYKYLKEPGFFANLAIKPGARDAILHLMQEHEVYIVTAYTAVACKDKVDFIKEHIPEFDVKNIIFINNKSLLDLDVLIDDGSHNLLGFKGLGICFDMPHNRDLKGFIRVRNWDDVMRWSLKGKRWLKKN